MSPWLHRRPVRLGLVVALLATTAFLAIDSVRRESVTVDEPLNLVGGYMAWAFGDYRLQESSGPLPQRWFAIPLLFQKVQFPLHEDEAWRRPGELGLRLCNQVLFDPANSMDAMVLAGRLMAVAIALAAVWAVYVWSARIFSPLAGLLACFFAAFSPTLLAHGPLMTSDVTAALFFLLSVGCFWSLLRRFTWPRVAASAVCFGLLLVAKMSGALLIPMAALMFITRAALGRPWPVRLRGFRPRQVRTWRGRLGLAGLSTVAHAAVALAIIWCFYGWRHQPSPDWSAERDSYTEPRAEVFGSLGLARAPLELLEKSRVLPDAYLYGLAHTARHAVERHAFLDGRYSTTGWWYYFPYCFLIKTPLTLMAFAAAGAAAIAWRIARRRPGRRAAFWAWIDRTSPIWSLLLVYGAASLFTNLNIGQRHLLPAYLPLFMVAGAAAWWFSRRIRGLRAALVLLLALHAGTVLRAHPHYLAYFNPLAGGPAEGYRRLTDSNVDWGQDLPSLARWLGQHRDLARDGELRLSWFGFDLPQRWGVTARPLPDIGGLSPRFSSADPLTCRAGTYCFSATYLTMPGPPWDGERERAYRAQLAQFGEMEATNPLRADDPASVERWRGFLSLLADRQYDRLRSYLLLRRPDAMIGYSILVFRLSDEEIRKALLPEGAS